MLRAYGTIATCSASELAGHCSMQHFLLIVVNLNSGQWILLVSLLASALLVISSLVLITLALCHQKRKKSLVISSTRNRQTNDYSEVESNTQNLEGETLYSNQPITPVTAIPLLVPTSVLPHGSEPDNMHMADFTYETIRSIAERESSANDVDPTYNTLSYGLRTKPVSHNQQQGAKSSNTDIAQVDATYANSNVSTVAALYSTVDRVRNRQNSVFSNEEDSTTFQEDRVAALYSVVDKTRMSSGSHHHH